MLIQLILANAGSNRVAILTAVVSMCSDLANVGSSQQQGAFQLTAGKESLDAVFDVRGNRRYA